MQILLTLLTLPLLAPTADSGDPIAELTRRMGFGDPAAYWVEYETRYFSITQAQAQDAKDHYAVTVDACHLEGETDSGERVAYRGSELPPCLMNVAETKLIQNSERFDVAWPSFRLETRNVTDAGSADWASLRVHDLDGLTVWQRDGSVSRPAMRIGVESPWDAESGAVTLFGRVFRQVPILLEEARRNDEILPHEAGFDALVSMLDAALMFRFDGMYLPNGVIVTPGYCEIEYRDYGTRSQLILRYRDCLDAEILTQTLRWEGDAQFLSAYEEQWWAPGADALIRHQVVSIAPIPGEQPTPESLRWRGEPGQTVYDYRFGVEETYRVGEGPRSDSAIAIAADASRNRAGELLGSPARVEPELVQGAQHFAVTGGDLPEYAMVGSRLRAEILVENLSMETRTFGNKTPSCGIASMNFDYDDVIGLQVATMELDLEVSDSGWNVFTVSAPYFGLEEEGSGQFELRLAIFGVDVGTMEPRVQGPILWIEGEPQPQLTCTWRDGIGGSQPVFETNPPALDVITHEVEDGVGLRLVGLPQDGGFGILPVELSTSKYPGAVMAQEAVILVDRVPANMRESWPSCLRTLSGSFPRRDRLVLPGVSILSATLVQEEGVELGRTLVELEAKGDTLHLVEPAPSGSRDLLASYRVQLETDIGPVQLFVYSAPVEASFGH